MTEQELDRATGIGPFLAHEWAHHLTVAIAEWGVKRVPQFLAQICHESQRFTRLEENLNYTTPERLRAVWPKRFKALDDALPFVRNPEGLANLVYGGRMGNNDPGDGWRYRGRGLKMVTGKSNYERFGKASGCAAVECPWLLTQPDYAASSAAWFWSEHKLDALTDVRAITKIVNGGEIGLDDRMALTERALRVFA